MEAVNAKATRVTISNIAKGTKRDIMFSIIAIRRPKNYITLAN